MSKVESIVKTQLDRLDSFYDVHGDYDPNNIKPVKSLVKRICQTLGCNARAKKKFNYCHKCLMRTDCIYHLNYTSKKGIHL